MNRSSAGSTRSCSREARVPPGRGGRIRGAVEFYERRRAGLGRRLRDGVAETVNRAIGNPDGGSPAEAGTRFRLVPRFGFVVYHLVVDDVLWIVAVTHGHRRPGHWQERLSDLPS